MKIRVNPHNVEIVREQTEPINELEVNVSKCEFEFDEKITNEFVKEAYFTLNGSTYKQIIVNNECDYPNEVLTEKGTLEIGVVAYKVENEEEIIRYNPSPDYYDTWVGSLKDAENTEPLTPTDKEQMQSQISQNTSDISDLQANKQDKLTQGDNITIDENNVISAIDTIYDDTEIKADIQELQETKIDKDVNNLTYYTLTTETGSKITLSIDSSTYVMTLKLKDKNNNDISTANVDLPLETMVVGARYDSATKEIILTLKNGQEVRFSVADLVSGLQTEITENNKLSSDLVDDTNNTNKFVSASEKAQITTNKNDITAIKDGEEIDSFADVENAFNGVDTALGLKEDKSNKVTEINSSSTDTQYPSAKCVYDSQEIQNEHIAELEMLYNAFPTVSDENETIQLDNTAEVKFREIDLKGNTSQVVIPEEQGTSVSNTSIYVSDVNTDKENTIEMSGNTYQKSSILPSEYTQVDYIQSTGNQYIDTGVNADKNLRVEMNTSFINPASANQTFGAIKTGSPNIRYHVLCGNQKIALWINDSTYVVGDLDSDKHYYDINPLESYAKFDDTTITIPSNIGDTTLNFWLFGRNSTGSVYMCAMKLWTCKMYYNNVLVRDFIPCYRNSDNVIGLYDIVNNVFYPNNSSSTITFTYGSVASIPNPDYPQNIEVVTETQNVEVCGKNLLDKNNLNIQNIYLSNSSKITGTNVGMGCIYIPCQPNTTYTVSKTELFGNDRFCIFDTEDIAVIGDYALSYAGQRSGYNSDISLTLTTNSNAKYLYMFIKASDTNPAKTLQEIAGTIQVEKNNIATTYEAYQGTTYPINLGNIELCKINTYQDRIYKSNDKWYLEKNIQKITVNGSEENWNLVSTYTNTLRFQNTSLLTNGLAQSGIKIKCNKFIALDNNDNSDVEHVRNAASIYSEYFFVFIDKTRLSDNTVNAFKTWLSSNNLLVYYILNTPTTTEITDTTLVNQLNALYNATIYPITNINTDTSNLLPYIDLHYNFVTPSPSPSRPSVVNVIKGNNTITISNSDNTESQVFPINIGDMELCKIGTYQDYIYENNGNWFKKGNIGKVTLNGSEDWQKSSRATVNRYFVGSNQTPFINTILNKYTIDIISNYFNCITPASSDNDAIGLAKYNASGLMINFSLNDIAFDTLNKFTNWLSTHNAIVYYVLGTPTDTQITDTTLITQLNNIKKAYSYDTQTNISQTNTDKPFIIYAEAIRSLKDVFE